VRRLVTVHAEGARSRLRLPDGAARSIIGTATRGLLSDLHPRSPTTDESTAHGVKLTAMIRGARGDTLVPWRARDHPLYLRSRASRGEAAG
jgi:hypothetical protein